MTKDDALRMMLGPFKAWRDVPGNEDVAEELTKIITAVEKVLAKEKALQTLHDENERLGLYRDAYAEQEQQPVAHDPLPRACNLAGVDYQTFLKIKAYMPVYDTTPPQRTWVGLTSHERMMCRSFYPDEAVAKTEAKLKEKNT